MDSTQTPLTEMLFRAQTNGYAVGAFNCRYSPMIPAVLLAAQQERSPVAIEIAQLELDWFGIELPLFMEMVERAVMDWKISVPFAVHLDHSWDRSVIERALTCGITSVMIDASSKPFEENIAVTRDIVGLAHAHGAGVEAELGKIGGADSLEALDDTSLYTDPDEAAIFVGESGCDFLAVSVGSAHGVYAVQNPTIDYGRLAQIRAKVAIPLVLHGGTGLPAATVRQAIAIPGGGISKMNVATELEMTLLQALGIKERLTPDEIRGLSPHEEKTVRLALVPVIADKMRHYLVSSGKA